MQARNMSSDDYQIENVYRYNRKAYKKNMRRGPHSSDMNMMLQDENINNESADCSPRSDNLRGEQIVDLPSCSCEMEPDEIANILHKKCPVITLAQQQLRRLLDETDNILCDNTRCCRSIYDFLYICKEVLMTRNKCICCTITLLTVVFLLGLVLGAASCGTYMGKFGSPILSCLDSYFTKDISYENPQDYLGIV